MARVHRAHMKEAREGAIEGYNGNEVRLLEQERSEESLRQIFGWSAIGAAASEGSRCTSAWTRA
jgi:hypothetical protein